MSFVEFWSLKTIGSPHEEVVLMLQLHLCLGIKEYRSTLVSTSEQLALMM